MDHQGFDIIGRLFGEPDKPAKKKGRKSNQQKAAEAKAAQDFTRREMEQREQTQQAKAYEQAVDITREWLNPLNDNPHVWKTIGGWH